ncbi:short-chain dehydrogenase [Hylemonella gracilis str. Niagara R]|uniref:Short-chain dehydrogenase n=1 Tax=Hylemonella gracilis str. Niagara R TaxID=1458275 RepID=A0A016XEP2_9BURK|nr:short-chain dehydrogenase [Hylemonella gracilis str. Niagara R]
MTSEPKTVLVTGGARRLGREIALALAQVGWHVAIHYRGSETEARHTVADCRRFGSDAETFDADLTDEIAVRALLPRVISAFGSVDAVVNSAALFEHDTASDFSYAAMERHLRVNTGAPILLAQALHAHAQERQAPGVIVNMLDQKLWNPNPDFLSYTLAKAALETANTLLALALAPQIRVVGVAPGLTLNSEYLSAEKFAALHRLSPLGRSSTPADVVATVKFALENCSITGTTLLVDGGQHLQRFDRDFSMM